MYFYLYITIYTYNEGESIVIMLELKMSIQETNTDLNTLHRSRITNIDLPIRRYDNAGNGRDYSSATYQSGLPKELHVLPEVNIIKNGTPVMISVNVEPTDDKIPNVDISSPYQCTTTYLNKTSYPIKVTDRNNISFTLPKASIKVHNEQDYFIVRKIHKFENSETARSILINSQQENNLLCINNKEREQIIHAISEAHSQGIFKNYSTYLEITIDRIIPIKLFIKSPSIYVDNLDLLFTIDGINIQTPHPNSQDAILRGEVLKKVGTKKITGAFYEVIDNSSEFDYKYVCLGKNTIRLPINKDEGKEPGIYYTYIDNQDSESLQIRLEHVRLEDAESIGIYNNKEMAETRSHVNEVLKAENLRLNLAIEKLQNENKINELERKKQIETISHEQKIEQSTIERETTERKRYGVIEQYELDRMAALRKDFYDERSAKRKDTSEIIKWAPTIVTSLVTMFGVYAVLKNKNG